MNRVAVTVREYRPEDDETFHRIDAAAFGVSFPEQDNGPELALLDHDRTLIAEVVGAPVGIASAYGFELTAPGGTSIRTAGTTWVGVLPTHRRRGVLRALMARHVRDSADRGDTIAALWASQPGIYGRFGYGVATRALRLSIDAPSRLAGAPEDPGLRVELAEPTDVREHLAAVYDRAGQQRPGSTSRDGLWWDRTLHDPEHRRGGASQRRALLAMAGSTCRGYALYSTTVAWSDDREPEGTATIRELVALDPAARAALWRGLLGHDFVRRAVWINAPTDEPLLEWLDQRTAVRGLLDQMYVRPLDLPAALTARGYAADADVVIEVSDDLLPGNAGRWHLVAGPGGATCERSTREPDVVADTRDVGALLMGARSLSGLVGAGVVHAPGADAAAALGRALRWEPDAWCPMVF